MINKNTRDELGEPNLGEMLTPICGEQLLREGFDADFAIKYEKENNYGDED